MRFLTPLVLLTLAPALAAPLLTSKASVAEGNFCKTYSCVLTDRRVNLPETLGLLAYTYSISGGVLSVSRESNMSIIGASLDLPAAQWSKPLVANFLRSFVGLTVEPSALRRCIRLATDTGSSVPTPLVSGKQGAMSFAVECRAERGRHVSLVVIDQSFEPR